VSDELAVIALSEPDQARAVQWVKAGLSRQAIANRLGVDVLALGAWLATIDTLDSTEAAKFYLRNQALPMAENIVTKGKPRDHVATLKGLSVLEDDQRGGVVVNVGGNALVQIASPLSPPISTSESESPQKR
jgi:hypothetical protein